MLVGVAERVEKRAARLTVGIFSVHINGKGNRQKRRTVEALAA